MLIPSTGMALVGLVLALGAYLGTQFEVFGVKIGDLTPSGRRRALTIGILLMFGGTGLATASAGGLIPTSLSLPARAAPKAKPPEVLKPTPKEVAPPAPAEPTAIPAEPVLKAAGPTPKPPSTAPIAKRPQREVIAAPEPLPAPSPPPAVVVAQAAPPPPAAPPKPATTKVNLDLSRLEAALRRDTNSAKCGYERGKCYSTQVYVDGRMLFGSTSLDLTPGQHQWRVVPYIFLTGYGPPEIRGSCSGAFEVQTEQIWLALRARFNRESDGAFRITDCQLAEP